MHICNDIVLPSGELNNNKILKREVLYKGMNGRNVERFYTSTEQSYIFKPLTNNSQLGKEVWIYEQVLPSIPPVYPKIIDKSLGEDVGKNWIIFEDLGELTHIYNEEVGLTIAEYMVEWHLIPIVGLRKEELRGPKPFIEEIVEFILLNKSKLMNILPAHGISKKIIEKVIFLAKEEEFSKCTVFSHGDLHLGNYAISGQKVVVLDWEHAHVNVPFWDLYHFIDMSHPLFPKKVTKQIREKLLNHYLNQAEGKGRKIDRYAFKREYYLFSSVFSIWMIHLIHNDLKEDSGLWPEEKLNKQLKETISSLLDCAQALKS